MIKRIIMVLLACVLIAGVCCAEEEYDLSTAKLIVFQTSNGIYRTVDFEGHFVGEDSETFPSDRIEDTAVCMEHGEFGYVAADGTTLIETQFYDVPLFHGDYAIVCKRDYDATDELDTFSGTIGTAFPYVYGVMDKHGSFIVPMEYDYIQLSEDGPYAIVSDRTDGQDREGLIDLTTGDMLIEPKYWSISDVHDGALVVTEVEINRDAENESGDEYVYSSGILSMSGEVLLPIEYDGISYVDAVHTFIVTDGDLQTAYKMVDGKLEAVE